MSARFLTKRAYDRRIMHVDLAPALRTGDMPNSVESVTAVSLTLTGKKAIPTFSDVSLDGTVVSFLIAGGKAHNYYNIVIRFDVASSPGQMLEAIARLIVE